MADRPVRAGAARYDPSLRAWVLSRYEDVSAALREPGLAAADTRAAETAHLEVREGFTRSLSTERLAAWHSGLERCARDRVMSLPADQVIDLQASFALPLSLELAATVAGTPVSGARVLADHARVVFTAAASGLGELQAEAAAAAAELARRLPGPPAFGVQAFVALSQTLPHLLGGVWLSLFGDPAATRRLKLEPGLMPRAIDELLRLASPSRAVFRRALEDVRIGGVEVAGGERVILMLGAANRDPARFPDPCGIDFDRSPAGHLGFGGGTHACSGARLVRLAMAAATESLLAGFDTVELAGPVEWLGGFAIRAPATLPVVLRRDTGEDLPAQRPGSSTRK